VDERLEKAFQTANYMTTLSNQRKVIFEEFQQSLIYYFQGASFTIDRSLITFFSALISRNTTSSVILDDNNIPVNIPDLSVFLDDILAIYTTASNEYIVKYNQIKTKRRVGDLMAL
jgi:hypothetical protein